MLNIAKAKVVLKNIAERTYLGIITVNIAERQYLYN